MKTGDIVRPLIGPYKGQPCEVIKVEFGTGAINGWITVKLPNGDQGLFAGEEVSL